eukprot:scaffold194178_cov18-Tisochrysis_lutea.AAC.1
MQASGPLTPACLFGEMMHPIYLRLLIHTTTTQCIEQSSYLLVPFTVRNTRTEMCLFPVPSFIRHAFWARLGKLMRAVQGSRAA